MNKTAEVKVGQCFRETGKRLFGAESRVWIVEKLSSGIDELPYAVVASLDDPSTRKTLSWGALLDRSRYERVHELEEQP
jgi:hypothetical protein